MTQNVDEPGLARNTSWMVLGFGLKIVVQAAYFVLIARSLGARGYGAFVGVVALSAIVAPFATWGSGFLVIKHVSRKPGAFAEYWGRALTTTGIASSVLTFGILAISRLVLPGSVSIMVLLLVALSDVVFGALLEISGQAFQAFQVLKRTAQLQMLPSIVKLAGAIVLVALPVHVSPVEWAAVYFVASACSAIVGLRLLRRELGRAKPVLPARDWEYREGFYFAVGISTQSVYNDIDKTMLARLSTLSATGIYAAAYRIIDVAVIPVRSVAYSTYTRFFKEGERGIDGASAYASRLRPWAWLYGVAVAIGLYLTAPLLPVLLGQQFGEAVPALRWLSLLPLMKGLSYLGANVLSGADRQGVRSAMQAGVAGFNVLINLWIIPRFGWRGAAWSSLASDGALVIAVWTCIAVLRRNVSRDAVALPALVLSEK